MRTLLGGNQYVSDIVLPGTGGITYPTGTTAQRPTVPSAGQTRFNSTLNCLEVYQQSKWNPLGLALNNGMPAYIEPVGSLVTSVAHDVYQLSSNDTNSASNYLYTADMFLSSASGYYMPRNALIRGVNIQVSGVSATATAFQIRVNKATTAAVTYTLPANTNHVSFNVSFSLNSGDEIAVYYLTTGRLTNPVIRLEISWRN